MATDDAIFEITDGTTTISLLRGEHGFHIDSWRPNAPQYKGGGTFVGSALSWNDFPIDWQYTNQIDTFTLKVEGESSDEIYQRMDNLRDLLQSAIEYFTSESRQNPVYIRARAKGETNARYAIILMGLVPEDEFPYGQPFLQPECRRLMTSISVAITHLLWQNEVPGSATCLPIAGYRCDCALFSLSFDGEALAFPADNVEVTDAASIRDLAAGNFTVEAWVKADGYGASDEGVIAWKAGAGAGGVGWYLRIDNALGLVGRVFFTGNDAISESGLDEFTADGLWHHVAMVYATAQRAIYLWIDGIAVTSYVTQQQSTLALVSDNLTSLFVGNSQDNLVTWNGDIGWVRVSNDAVYAPAVNFQPPERCRLPSDHAFTQLLMIYEGRGTIADDLSGNNNDGTITGPVWNLCDTTCCKLVGSDVQVQELYYGLFDGTSSRVSIADAATSIRNLHDDAMTVEAWIRYDGAGETPTDMRIVCKGVVATNGWQMYWDSTNNRLAVAITCAVQPAFSYTNVRTDIEDGNWHHVAFTWDDATYTSARIWVDGVEDSVEVSARNGAIVSDSGQNCYIGNNTARTRTWNGAIGWVRISQVIRYTATFTPFARCTIPPPTATSTVWLGHASMVGSSPVQSLWLNMSGEGQNGVAEYVLQGSGCISTTSLGLFATCTEPVYVRNVDVRAQITDVFYYDASLGTYSPNLLGVSPPYPLLPGTVAAGDILYIGANSDHNTGVIFSNVVFNLSNAGAGITYVPEFWNGAWAALTLVDYTDSTGNGTGQPLTQIGKNPFSFNVSSLWTTTTVNGITGYWIRLRVSGVASPITPIQAHEQIHQVNWGNVQIDADDIQGRVESLARYRFYHRSDQFGAAAPNTEFDHLVVGLRSHSRGTRFNPYLQASDYCTVDGLTCSEGSPSLSFFTFARAPTSRVIYFQPTDTTQVFVQWRFDPDLYQHYKGTYRCFVRLQRQAGNYYDMRFRVYTRVNAGGGLYYTDYSSSGWQIMTSVDAYQCLDMGLLSIPGRVAGQGREQFSDIEVVLGCQATNLAPTEEAYIYDVVLIPADEWLGVFMTNTTYADLGWVTDALYMELDSAYDQRSPIFSRTREVATNQVRLPWGWNTPGPAILHARSDQSVWPFNYGELTVAGGFQSILHNLSLVEIEQVQRYKTSRGGS